MEQCLTLRCRSHNAWLRFIAIRCRKPRHLHDAKEYAHLAYFAAVWATGHGLYAHVGGLLLIIGAIALFYKDGDV